MVMVTSLYSIAQYMNQSGLNTNDVSLTEACQLTNAKLQAAGKEDINMTCTFIEYGNLDWDTKIGCVDGFQMDKYHWTMRQFFGLQGVSRRMKSDDDVSNEILAHAGMTNDEKGICMFPPEAQAEYKQWLESEKRDLIWGFIGRVANNVIRGVGDVLRSVGIRAGYGWHHGGFFKACSLKAGLAPSDYAKKKCGRPCCDGGTHGDAAQCAGPYGECCKERENGRHNFWHDNMNSQGSLNQACVRHDKCVYGIGGGYSRDCPGGWSKSGVGNCDDKLKDAACGASFGVAQTAVCNVMKLHPNGKCTPPPPPRRRRRRW